jgi:hypothetical protein
MDSIFDLVSQNNIDNKRKSEDLVSGLLLKRYDMQDGTIKMESRVGDVSCEISIDYDIIESKKN